MLDFSLKKYRGDIKTRLSTKKRSIPASSDHYLTDSWNTPVGSLLSVGTLLELELSLVHPRRFTSKANIRYTYCRNRSAQYLENAHRLEK